jgi:hypothetical protein
VDDALERRNYLSHHFFRTHNYAIFNAQGRQAMVDELKGIQCKLDLAHGALSVLSEALLRIGGRGGSSETIGERFLTQAKRVDI